jgi:hypothetical protein
MLALGLQSAGSSKRRSPVLGQRPRSCSAVVLLPAGRRNRNGAVGVLVDIIAATVAIHALPGPPGIA